MGVCESELARYLHALYQLERQFHEIRKKKRELEQWQLSHTRARALMLKVKNATATTKELVIDDCTQMILKLQQKEQDLKKELEETKKELDNKMRSELIEKAQLEDKDRQLLLKDQELAQLRSALQLLKAEMSKEKIEPSQPTNGTPTDLNKSVQGSEAIDSSLSPKAFIQKLRNDKGVDLQV